MVVALCAFVEHPVTLDYNLLLVSPPLRYREEILLLPELLGHWATQRTFCPLSNVFDGRRFRSEINISMLLLRKEQIRI